MLNEKENNNELNDIKHDSTITGEYSDNFDEISQSKDINSKNYNKNINNIKSN